MVAVEGTLKSNITRFARLFTDPNVAVTVLGVDIVIGQLVDVPLQFPPHPKKT
jgi:hypothetical protein